MARSGVRVFLSLAVLLANRLGVTADLVLGSRSLLRKVKGGLVTKNATEAIPLPESTSVVVKLRRIVAKTPAQGGEAAFYIGDISVGSEGQKFSVLFDTAAGNVILPSASCTNTTCMERRRYTAPASAGINLDGSQVQADAANRDVMRLEFSMIDLGSGEVEGAFARDKLCLGTATGDSACAEMGIIAATDVAEVPFRAMPLDGMVGLGLDGLTAASPFFMFLRRLGNAKGLLPQFSISFRGAEGELAFGALGPSFSRASPIQWSPVVSPELGYWQVGITAVQVGDRIIEACEGGCRGIVDTSASKLGVPAALVPRLGAALAPAPAPGGGCTGSELHLLLTSGYKLTLRPVDYAGPSCGTPQLAPLSLEPAAEWAGVFVLGESILQRYDAAFDWGENRVGFSLNAPRAVRLGSATPERDQSPLPSARPSKLEEDAFQLLEV